MRSRKPEAAWLRELLANKPVRVVSEALANKLARIAWALLSRQDVYRPYQRVQA